MPINVKIIGSEALVKSGAVIQKSVDKLVEDVGVESERFALNAVRIAKDEYLSGPRPEKLGHGKGALASSIAYRVIKSGKVWTTSIGSNLKYAAIQEEGGETHPNVTAKMRAWAWRMFFETHDDKFMHLALTKKTQLTINIPPRPYLRPAINDAMPAFTANLRAVMANLRLVE